MGSLIKDELIFCGVLLTLAFVGFMAYDLLWLGHSFDPFTFGTGGASLLGGHGGAQMLRDRWTPTDTTPSNAEKE